MIAISKIIVYRIIWSFLWLVKLLKRVSFEAHTCYLSFRCQKIFCLFKLDLVEHVVYDWRIIVSKNVAKLIQNNLINLFGITVVAAIRFTNKLPASPRAFFRVNHFGTHTAFYTCFWSQKQHVASFALNFVLRIFFRLLLINLIPIILGLLGNFY